MTRQFILILTFFFTLNSFCQKGVIKGKLIDFNTGQPIAEAPVILYGTVFGSKSDSEGQFVLNNLKLENIELIVHGQPVLILDTGEKTAQNNNYYTLILKNIKLTRKNKVIDLGILYMINIGNENKYNELPCKKIKDKFYSYKLIDGEERHVTGKMGMIDFDVPSANCKDE